MDKNIIATNIKKYRKSKKITQKELGDLLGKSLSTIQKYESGEIEVALDILIKISKILDIDMYRILYSEDSEYYKEYKREQKMNNYLSKSYRNLDERLSNNALFNFTQKELDLLLESLNLSYVYDTSKDIVYVFENCPEPNKINVTSIESFLNMIQNIYSIKDNFLCISPTSNLSYKDLLNSLIDNEDELDGE